MARRDPHSYTDDTQAQTDSFSLKAGVDFASRTIAAEVVLTFKAPSSGTLDLDTRDLVIEHVEDASGQTLPFVLHPAEPYLGQRLTIEMSAQTPSIRIRYKTSPEASALQWLEPAQTKGGAKPFLFSQCQAIHARSIIPMQDTPRLRVTYTAELAVPRDLAVVMAAADRGRSETGEVAHHRFEMPQAIPPYLFAFAVGDLTSRDLSPRCRVWAEPSVVESAAWEFADVEAMIGQAEALFGPYDWERFDILTMPPSFPYGGMENPRLTFLTPTVIAGDRSLVSVVAHELAHSWTGNLVTNANAEHFWLNEGFTMYAERRIVEALDGVEMATLQAALGRRELDESLERFADRPAMTKLRTHLDGVDPDECYSLIPYEKGYMFLCEIERVVGRQAFARWLRSYLDTFRFGAITTEEFEAHIEAALPGALDKANARAWIDGEGVPASAKPQTSARLSSIELLASSGNVPTAAQTKGWTPIEWALYLESVPRPAPAALCQGLDDTFKLTASTNFDVLVPWLTLALKSGYTAVMPRVEQVVAEVGRMKYLRPLYTALAANPALRETAVQLLAKNSASYHPIARQMVDGVLKTSRSSS
ncbi:MAG: M1 family metallopeptidase [Kofleriaceae bacterium]|nr:M1 family metallopeptidase [Kofleriaceae bacterium]